MLELSKNFQYDIEYVKSQDNQAADSLSRLPLIFEEMNTWENVDINFVNYFSNNNDFAINFEQVKMETSNDSISSQVIKFVRSQ